MFAEHFPKCFKPKGALKLPLKIGIQDDIKAFWPDIEMCEIRDALRDYTDGPKYLLQCKTGAARFDLDGYSAGEVKFWEEKHSLERLRNLELFWVGKPSTIKDRNTSMCGSSKPISENAFVSAPSVTLPVNPSVTSEPDFALQIEREMDAYRRDNAAELIRDRDAMNVAFGKGLGSVSNTTVVADPIDVKAVTRKAFEVALAAMQAGRKIDAIKEVRAATNMGLKEAKDWVEGFTATVVPQPATQSQDRYIQDGFMVLSSDAGGYSFSLESTYSYLSDAQRSAEAEARSMSFGRAVMLVQVIGRTKPVFSMIDKAA